MGFRNNGEGYIEHEEKRKEYLATQVQKDLFEWVKKYKHTDCITRTDIRPDNLMKKYHVKFFQLSLSQVRALSRKDKLSSKGIMSPISSPDKNQKYKSIQDKNRELFAVSARNHEFDSSAMNSLRHRIDKIYSKFFRSANYNDMLKSKLETYRKTPWRTARDNYSNRWRSGINKSNTSADMHDLTQLDIVMQKSSEAKVNMLADAPLKQTEIIVTRSSIMKIKNNIVTRPIKKIFHEQKSDLCLIPEKNSNLEEQLAKRRKKEEDNQRRKIRKQGILISKANPELQGASAKLKLLTQMMNKTSMYQNVNLMRTDINQRATSPARPTLVHSLSMNLKNESAKTLNETNTEAVSQFKNRSVRFHNLIDEKINVMGAKSESELLNCLNTIYYSRQKKTRREKSDKKVLSQALPKPKNFKVKETRKQLRTITVYDSGYYQRRGSAPDKTDQSKNPKLETNITKKNQAAENSILNSQKKVKIETKAARRESFTLKPDEKFVFRSAKKTLKKQNLV